MALPLDDPALAGQRADYLAAERALARGRMSEFRALLSRLEGYPLLGYLRSEELERRLARADDAEVIALLETYAGQPPVEALRSHWLQRLAARRDWQTLLDHWRTQRDDELRCAHARALFETGRHAAAMSQARDLWLVGHSQPDACDAVFRRWRKDGGLDVELVWRRMTLAISSRDRHLQKYLRKLLPPSVRPLADLHASVRAKPALVAEAKRFMPDGERTREVRLYGLKRLARHEPEAAADAWREMQNQHAWSDVERAIATRAIGLGYAQEQMAGGGDWLDAIDDRLADDQVWEWRAIARLREADWARLADVIDRMPPSVRGDEVWIYWRARAAEHLGDRARARSGYERLAGERSFHGFLAADRLGRPYDFGMQRLRFDEDELRTVAAIPGIARARELLALGRELPARREWYAALEGLDDTALQRAARLAQLWGWHPQAIFTVARASHFDDIELRFPLLYTKEVTASALAQDIEPAWLLAVMRQESAFMTDARSPAGALGLMQIMPATGRHIARALKHRYRGSRTLLDPPTSIRFGAHYLRTLLDRFGGHPALAIAAYNAGARRAEDWRPLDENMAADRWIDTVPYRETRRYLQRIFYYTAIYEKRLGLPPTRLSTRLGPVPARATETPLSNP